jgi:hypothetical protein
MRITTVPSGRSGRKSETTSIFTRYAISGRHVLRSQVAKLAEHYGAGPESERKVVSIWER